MSHADDRSYAHLDICNPVVRVSGDDILGCFDDMYRMKKPVIISNNHWKAESDWKSICYLTELLHDPCVEVLISNDDRRFLKHELCTVEEMELSLVLSRIFSIDEDDKYPLKLYCRLYLDMYPELAQDIDTLLLSRLAGIENFKGKNCGVWISSQGCETPLHYDLCHGFLAQIVGRKRFLLASPADTPCMYRTTSHATKNTTSSRADLSAWLAGSTEERRKHSALGDAQWFIAELGPGDVLYTPPGWWHQVVSEDSCVSVLLPFDMVPPAEQLATLLCC